ncbi:hypothetical protein QYM36_012610, partial [Artemia franciscana]
MWERETWHLLEVIVRRLKAHLEANVNSHTLFYIQRHTCVPSVTEKYLVGDYFMYGKGQKTD